MKFTIFQLLYNETSIWCAWDAYGSASYIYFRYKYNMIQ